MCRVVSIGCKVKEILEGNMLILFSENVPNELAPYCVLHTYTQPLDLMTEYRYLQIGEVKYIIHNFGSEAYHTWNELGHLTIRLESEEERLPGSVYVCGPKLYLPQIGEEIRFLR
mgnify:CR=1 FL=1